MQSQSGAKPFQTILRKCLLAMSRAGKLREGDYRSTTESSTSMKLLGSLVRLSLLCCKAWKVVATRLSPPACKLASNLRAHMGGSHKDCEVSHAPETPSPRRGPSCRVRPKLCSAPSNCTGRHKPRTTNQHCFFLCPVETHQM